MAHDIPILLKENIAVSPTVCGYELCKSGWHYGPTVRMFWLIHYIESGFGIFKIGNKTYHLGPGELFIIPPYVETYYEADSKRPWKYNWIGFKASGPLPLELPDTVYCPKAQSIFNDMLNSEKLSYGRSEFLISRIWELFSVLSESIEKEDEVDYVSTALSYIHAQFIHTDLSVAQLAEYLNLDRTYFSTIFKKRMGLSPSKYILSYRMNMAAQLLVGNKSSVTVAANSVGYTDIYNFSKMFKQHFGMSPRAYIAKHGKKEER